MRILVLIVAVCVTVGCSAVAENLRHRQAALPESTEDAIASEIPVDPPCPSEPELDREVAKSDANLWSPEAVMIGSAIDPQVQQQRQVLVQRWDDSFSPSAAAMLPTVATNEVPFQTVHTAPAIFRLVPMKEAEVETAKSGLAFNSNIAAAPIPTTGTQVVSVEQTHPVSGYTSLHSSPESSPLVVEDSAEGAGPEVDASSAPRELDHLFEQLRSDSCLRLNRVCFCQRVEGFGQVTECGEPDFAPGQRVLIYCEVDNFKTEISAQPGAQHRASLSGCYVVTNAAGEVVAEKEYSAVDDVTQSMREDFFLVFPARIPDLPPGSYRFFLVVYDEVAQDMVAQAVPIPFRINTTAASR